MFGRDRLERVRRAATSHGFLPTPPSSFSSIIIFPIPHHLTLIVKCRAPGCRVMPTTWEPTWAWESAANLSGPGNLPGPGNHDFSQPAKAFSLQPSMLSEPSTNFPLLPPVNLGCVCVFGLRAARGWCLVCIYIILMLLDLARLKAEP